MREFKKYYLLPSSIFVSDKPYQVTTILGSCVAVCLWDKKCNFGGINHFMLPLWNGEGLASPKYGNIAIERLVNKMNKLGSQNEDLVAKVFGGGNILMNSEKLFNIGERNIFTAFKYLKTINIPIISESTGGYFGRKIIFSTFTGQVRQKYINNARQNSK